MYLPTDFSNESKPIETNNFNIITENNILRSYRQEKSKQNKESMESNEYNDVNKEFNNAIESEKLSKGLLNYLC